MSYLGELRTHWRSLLASTLGHGAGLGASAYIIGTFAPHLLAEFGWSKADFALMGTVTLLTLVLLPFVGRLTDLFGVRRVATTGVIFLPLSYYGLSYFNGSLYHFIGIVVLQVLFGISTSTAVYSRLVAERFVTARGMGLAIMASGPAIAGAIGAPLLSDYIDAHGWRAGYQMLALFTAVFGLAALALIPPDVHHTPQLRAQRRGARDYRTILRSPAFWVIAGGIFLCNIPAPLHGVQLKLMLLDNQADSAFAARLVSLYATGVIIGRFVCGVALDRLPAHWVAAVGMGLPSIGMFLLASSIDTPMVLTAAVMLMGLSQGAEGDIAGYLVLRHFKVDIYSSVLGMVIAALGFASSLGAGLLSLALKLTGGYGVYLILTAFGVAIGSALFLLLGRRSMGEPHAAG
ncbi:MAG TPA: MFS transporter [Fontimonas sp.]